MPDLHGLYAITDAALIPEQVFERTIRQALHGGASIIQYRDKSSDSVKRLQQAIAIKKLCAEHDALLIINDDVSLAEQVDAHGVHIGIDDTTLAFARQQLGKDRIIGVSCYNQMILAEQAAQQGADYVAFGSFFNSPTKPEAAVAELALLHQAKQQLSIPVCAIGGITHDNAALLIKQGADMLAVISAVFGASNVEQACQQFYQLFNP